MMVKCVFFLNLYDKIGSILRKKKIDLMDIIFCKIFLR